MIGHAFSLLATNGEEMRAEGEREGEMTGAQHICVYNTGRWLKTNLLTCLNIHAQIHCIQINYIHSHAGCNEK